MASILLALLPSIALFSTTIPLRSGGSVSLHGRGPPVLFSTGLFGTMPHWIYSEFFRQMTPNVTLVVLNGPSPLTGDRVDEISNAIAVDQIGFFAHSSTDRLALDSPRVGRVVLCDPVIVPQLSLTFRMTSTEVSNPVPFLVLRAGQSYATSGGPRPIPDFLGPRLPSESTNTVTFEGMGHADLLDDLWADLGASAIPWMRGPVSPVRPFREWTPSPRGPQNELSRARRAYRAEVAERAVAHFLDDSAYAIPERGLKQANEGAPDPVSAVNDAKEKVDDA